MTAHNHHHWRFFRAGGFDQVRLDSGADLMHLGELDGRAHIKQREAGLRSEEALEFLGGDGLHGQCLGSWWRTRTSVSTSSKVL